MMDIVLDILAWISILTGSAFLLIGAFGLIRLPDFYTRLHAAGVIDTSGAELILLGMMLQSGLSFVTIKLFLIGAFIFFTSPTSTHAIANAAYIAGLKPLVPVRSKNEVKAEGEAGASIEEEKKETAS